MSEINPSAEELIRNVRFTIQRSSVIPMPIDPTLSIEGEAADAKATGDAIAGVIGNLRVNTKAPVNNAITVYGTDIRLSNAEGAPTLDEAISGASDRDASSIMYDDENLITVAMALDDLYTTMDTGITDDEIDEILDEVFGGDD